VGKEWEDSGNLLLPNLDSKSSCDLISEFKEGSFEFEKPAKFIDIIFRIWKRWPKIAHL
jgi:hypothetical protein